MEKAIRENSIRTRLGKKFHFGNAYSFTVKKGYSYLCMWTTSNWMERNKISIRCGKYSVKKLIWENRHRSLTMFIWIVLKENVKQAKILWTIKEICLNPNLCRDKAKSNNETRIQNPQSCS